jgi:TolB protein
MEEWLAPDLDFFPLRSTLFSEYAQKAQGEPTGVIAYVSAKGNRKDIVVMDHNGTNRRPFVADGSLNLFPRWSPDYTKLAFISDRTGRWEISIRSYPEGSELRRLSLGSHVYAPAFTPDGNRLLFPKMSLRGDPDLFISNLDGSDCRNLINHPSVEAFPTWAPSGERFAFVSNRDRSNEGRIRVADSDGGNIRQIGKDNGTSDSPAWSVDGQFIAFQWKSRQAKDYDIYVVDVATGDVRQVTRDCGSNEHPSWAPGGGYLAIQSTRSGTPQIFIVGVDGTVLRQLTYEGTNTTPSWGGKPRQLRTTGSNERGFLTVGPRGPQPVLWHRLSSVELNRRRR